MTADQGGLRSASAVRNGACVAIACGMTLMASTLMAEDISKQRLSTGDSIILAQTVESGAPSLSNLQDGTTGTAIQRRQLSYEELDTAASGLNDALDGARSKLDQLREAADIAAIAAALRDELEAGAEENNRLAAGLTKAEATQRSLEISLEKADGQIAEFTKALDQARSEASDRDQQLRKSREQAAATDAARVAAVERAGRAEDQLADSRGQNQSLSLENKALKDKVKVARLERDDARLEIEVTRQEREAAQQELDTIRLRIAGLLRSVLHADEPTNATADQKGAALASSQTAVAGKDNPDRTYKIVQTSNIRSEPHRDATRVDIGVAGESVSVLRKIPDDNWFEVKTRRGITGYIFGELIQPES